MKTSLIIVFIVINIICVAIAKQNAVQTKEDTRRSWENAKSIWGKRASSSDLKWSMPVWGKRAMMYRLMYGKRFNGNDWQGAQGIWGKRSSGFESMDSIDSETQQNFMDV